MTDTNHRHTNRLIDEKSPYLLQHAHNPVDWHSWDQEAFEKAKREDKPIFLSIGYSTCHWCHVMERESFENEAIAAVMNEHFINIKVDREERPDVDQIYMSAVQAMTGRGGWPLSVFLTHDLEPFFGGTYFPPDRRYGFLGFPEILKELARLWREERQKALETGQQLGKALRESSSFSSRYALSEDPLKNVLSDAQRSFDPDRGGFGPAPKFPRSELISLLLHRHHRTQNPEALSMALFTLEKMARGGLYDHVGGGFHRYSTDAEWLVPHFEKMLYDNALLAKTYLEASQQDENPLWAGVSREILDYVIRDMTTAEGGYASAEDADSEGEEGKFYVWSEQALKNILTPIEFEKIKEVFQTSPEGNFEGQNILWMGAQVPWAERYQEPLRSSLKKIFQHRQTRIPPLKDDKVLVSWNGLMIRAMSYGAQILGEEKYLFSAQRAANFVWKTLWDGKNLKRRSRQGDVRFKASLEDYAFFIQGLLDLYETDFDDGWFQKALTLQERMDELFWDENEGGYFFSESSDPTLLTRTKEVYDGAIPSGNSVAALNLVRLYALTMEKKYQDKFEKMKMLFGGFAERHPQASAVFLTALDAAHAMKEIVVVGSKDDPERGRIIQKIRQKFLFHKVLVVSDPETTPQVPLAKGKTLLSGRVTIYICENHVCQKPVHEV